MSKLLGYLAITGIIIVVYNEYKKSKKNINLKK
jgi:hypothetical protein